MTGDESRKLSVGSRVCWAADQNDHGTVALIDWTGVTIKWDNGDTNHIQHNDMSEVTAVQRKV